MTRPRPGRLRRWFGRALKIVMGTLAAVALLTVVVGAWGSRGVTVRRPAGAPVVNDVTRLNPIPVARVVTPTSTEAVAAAVRAHDGPVAIGGGRFSMGGQTATRGALQLDMRRFNRILAIDSAARTITVQAGVRWRQIQEAVDPLGLSVKIMQTYANFTVGGSLSVNVHGRYVGLGPLVLSVRRLTVVLADGSIVTCSPTERPELFFGVIGGYGGLGVITEATLELAENVRVRRTDRVMPLAEYGAWFRQSVRGRDSAIFHNADIYPDAYEAVNAVTYWRTEAPVTVPERLKPLDRDYGMERAAMRVIADWPGGKWLRQHLVDPWLFRDEPVSWRNHEASYDVAELEPASREASTYVLEEYFVPVDSLQAFVPTMGEILRRHDVNVINVSIRHALPDPGTLLAWARGEVFAFVLYYKQGTSVAARAEVAAWTRELIDLAVSLGGAYYLPYQPHATPEQFHAAYPRARELFALKAQLDPANRFRNTLWDTYYPEADPVAQRPPLAAVALADSVPGYRRDGGQTFLTHPEWYIVYSSEEYADWLGRARASAFPYGASIAHFWLHYAEMRRAVRHRYPFNAGYHVMLWVIGASYSAELALKGLYESTVGRLAEWTAGGQLTAADRYAAEVAADYGRFIHERPWYEYRFLPKLAGAWTQVPLWGEGGVRLWERRLFLSLEYGVKALYATLIAGGTAAAYDPEAARMGLLVRHAPAGGDSALGLRIERPAAAGWAVATLPRYDRFRDAMLAWAARDTAPTLAQVAGNEEIVLTGLAPAGWQYRGTDATFLYAMAQPSDAATERVTLRAPVMRLVPLLRALRAEGAVRIDHIYDY